MSRTRHAMKYKNWPFSLPRCVVIEHPLSLAGKVVPFLDSMPYLSYSFVVEVSPLRPIPFVNVDSCAMNRWIPSKMTVIARSDNRKVFQVTRSSLYPAIALEASDELEPPLG
ncbi:hypothetical protein J6590_102440 [Homalodisca vitripennis]|nr:hypothetical protein J6590_102440 [Homalodisca vitripennis]